MSLSFLILTILSLKVASMFPFPRDDGLRDCFLPVIAQSNATTVHLVNPSPISSLHNSTFSWCFINREEDLVLTHRRDVCVISAKDVVSMMSLLERFQKCSKGNSILAFTAYIEDEVTSVQRIFDVAWKLGLIDIVVVTHASSNCNVYTYFPFQEHGKCIDTEPVLLVSWNETLNADVTFFPNNKISNLHSCKLVFEVSVIDRSVRNYNYLWGPLVSFLLRAMNASGEVSLDIEQGFPEIIGNTSNVLMGKFHLTPKRLNAFVIPSYIVASRVFLAVPSMPVAGVQWFRLVDEVSPSVWYGIALSFLVSLAIFYAVMKDKYDLGYIVMFGLQSLLNIPCRYHTLPWYGRLYFISFVCFSFVLSETYLSQLLIQLTFPFTRESINSIEAFLASGLSIHVPIVTKDHMLQLLSLDPRLHLLKDRIKFVYRRFLEVVDRSRQDLAYFSALDIYEEIFSNLSYHVLPDAGYDTLRTFVMLPRPSPYEDIVNKAILQIYEAGCFAFVDRRERNRIFISKSRKSNSRAKALSFASLRAVFVLWLIGCIVGLVSFICEVFSGQRFRIK